MENITGTTETRYKIKARIDLESAKRAGIDNTDGYDVHDYFTLSIGGIHHTREEAEMIVEAGYKGPDVDGVGCTWEIVEVDADHFQPTGN